MDLELSRMILRWLTWNSIFAAFVFVTVAVLLRFWRRPPAAIAHLCWWLVLVRLVLPVDFGLPFSIGSLLPAFQTGGGSGVAIVSFPLESGGELHATGAAAASVPDNGQGRWPLMLLIVWGLGAISTFAWLIHRRRTWTAHLRAAEGVADRSTLAVFDDCASRLDLQTGVRLVHGDGNVSPFTKGVIRPVVWIPTGLMKELDPTHLRCLLAHELVHVSRRDDIVIQIQLILQSLFFFHPLVWLAGAELDRTREQACDEHVVSAFAIAPHDYGRSLVETLRLNYTVASPLASFGGGRKRSLEMRLRALSNIPMKSRLAFAVPFVVAWLFLPLARAADAETAVTTEPASATTASRSAAPKVSDEEGIARVGGEIMPPKVIKRVEPEYPKEARREGVVGIVILEAVIDETGRVERVKALKELPLGLTEAAIDAVRQWEFEPARKGDLPVKVFFNLTFNFKLGPGVKLIHPLPEGRVTSRFGDERGRETETMKIHTGLDLAAAKGTPVLAAAAGEVVTATTYDPERQSAGTFVIIDHGAATKTFYSHLDTLAVATGQRVRQGETIGTVGSTGVSDGPHLHFEVWSGDHPVDPMRLLK